MATEIERKFLVAAPPPGVQAHPYSDIAQGYLAVAPDGTEVRLRQQRGRHSLAVKSGLGTAREHREVTLSAEQFEALWPATEGRRIEKTRYEIPHLRRTIELDVFREALGGLVIAEVEFGSMAEAEAFEAPDWFGTEVTDDARYSNQNLATHGMPHKLPG